VFLIKPKFWDQNEITFLRIILLPLSYIYYFIIFLKKIISKPKKFHLTIICVGNIYVGGTGKTSVSIEIFKTLENLKKICFLTKGYGRKSNKDFFYKKNSTNENEHVHIGDEAILLNKVGPVYISNNRRRALNQIQQLGFEAVIMDDGLQDYCIKKDLKIVCFDSKKWVGNGELLPAGPLREKLDNIKDANFVVLNGNKNTLAEEIIKNINPQIKVLYLEKKLSNKNELITRKYIVFCGLGNPESFFELLEFNNIKIKKKIIFPDHHLYNAKDMELLKKYSNEFNCNLLTTEKDSVRINNDFKKKLHISKIKYNLSDTSSLVIFFNQVKK